MRSVCIIQTDRSYKSTRKLIYDDYSHLSIERRERQDQFASPVAYARYRYLHVFQRKTDVHRSIDVPSHGESRPQKEVMEFQLR